MKKVFLSIVFAAAMMTANAQTMTSKNGTPILPEAGDWSIGFDVVPVLQDFGNVFHTTNEPNILSQAPLTLVALHVMDANTAWRMRVRIGFGSTTTDNEVTDNATPGTAAAPLTVTDEWKHSYDNITLGAGLQKSIGNGRVHGIYGVELAVMFGGTDDKYSYGNPYSATNPNPTSTTPANYNAGTISATANGSTYATTLATERTTEIKGGSTFGIGLDGFIGVEYFFAPKMSLSAEYNWGLLLNSTGQGSVSTETGTGTAVAPFSNTPSINTGKESSFALDVTNATSIILHFYF